MTLIAQVSVETAEFGLDLGGYHGICSPKEMTNGLGTT